MDYKRIALAAVVAWIVDSIYGVVVWMMLLGGEFAKYPAVFRPESAMGVYMPLMFAGSLLGIAALTFIYAKGYEGGSGIGEGLRFGFVVSLFMVGCVSVSILASFNVPTRLALLASVASFFEFLLVGAAIGLAYHPVTVSPTARAATA